MLWDRKLISFIFGFDYTWEIYTPESKRKYGYYVLPILHNESLIGRIEMVNDKKTKTLIVKNLWLEESIKETKQLTGQIQKALKRFMGFNQLSNFDTINLVTIHTINEF
jgi:uncharacterized protein YcaQ